MDDSPLVHSSETLAPRGTKMFMRASISLRLGIAVASVALLISLLAGISAWLQFTAAAKAADDEGEYVAVTLASAIHPGDLERGNEMARTIEVLQARDKGGFVVLDRDRKVVVETHSTLEGRTYQDDPNGSIHAALEGAEISHFIRDDGRTRRNVVVPIIQTQGKERRVIGAVLYDYTQSYDEQMDIARWAVGGLAIASLMVALLAVILGAQLRRSITAPLSTLRRCVAQIASGQLRTRVPVRSNDEIGELALAVNAMAQALESSHASLLQRIENERIATERTEYLAFHDTLTGLPNRASFSAALSRELVQARGRKSSLSVIFIDLDRFKPINDSFGHSVGDQFLCSVAQRLRGTIRGADLLARLGGDEFVVLLPSPAGLSAATALAARIQAALVAPFNVLGNELRASASVGISVFPEHGLDEETLMKRADTAMYGAKERGRGTVVVYDDGLERHSFERLAMETSLRHAIENNELTLHFQPKLAFATGRITGIEALLRWNHPQLGMVSPLNFIPIAEESGLIEPIGRWVLEVACRQVMQWKTELGESLVMAVNLSPRQFASATLLRDIEDILTRTAMDPTLLELEITESTIMADTRYAYRVLQSLKSRGIRIAIDDFGTGYSSLSSLKVFPIDTLKIDRSFIRGLPHGEDDSGIAEAIIGMAKTLRLHLVAEGVETDAQAEFLRARHCDEFQGFLFSKPLPAADAAALMRDHFRSEHGPATGIEAPPTDEPHGSIAAI